jgi:amino acid adenylation domain-containing protein
MADTLRSDERIKSVGEPPPFAVKALDKEIEVAHFPQTTRDSFASVATWFSEIARTQPHSLAVTAGAEHLSYGQLEERANQLAHRLQSLGVSKGTVVGLFLNRSISLAVGALGVLKAGGAYLPLDPGTPSDRLSYVLEDSGAAILIIDSQLLTKVRAGAYQIMDLDREVLNDFSADPPRSDVSSGDLAYVIYTSGSTGAPKGVEISHHSLLNLVAWHHDAFNVLPSDRASHLAGLGFDAAVWELWPYLTAGASVHFVPDRTRNAPEKLQEWLQQNKITISFAPTPLAEFLLDMTWPPDTPLRIMLTGGDTLHKHPPKHVPFRLINNYGPTECTVVTTSAVVAPAENADGLPRIGWPIRNARIHILDENLRRVPDGEPGELFIGGTGLARGYRNRPELTAERFISDPETGTRLYRTGDLVRLCPDGQLAFIGRVDEQIKIDGYRIEPHEIVKCLGKHPAVHSSAVVSRDDAHGRKKLVAYVVARPGCELCREQLRGHLETWLPSYMIPSTFVSMDELPLTSNGKVDRAALPAPMPHNILRKAPATEPNSAIQQRLASILSKLLGVEDISGEDDFFTLGGHSLLGTQLIGRIRDAFGVELSLRAVFDSPTIFELSRQIEQLLLAKVDSMTDEEATRLLSEPGLSEDAL